MEHRESQQWQQVIDMAQGLIELHPRRAEGYRHIGDAIMMIGLQEQEDQAALERLDESELNLRKGLGLCNGAEMREEEKQIEQSLFKNAKLKQLRQIRVDGVKKGNILADTQSAMEEYLKLMVMHSKQAAENDNPM